jgi:hypothetical protein
VEAIIREWLRMQETWCQNDKNALMCSGIMMKNTDILLE